MIIYNYVIFCKFYHYVHFCLSSKFSRCKKRHIVNENTRKVKYVKNNTIFLESSKGILAAFPVLENGSQYYLLVAGYSSTVFKIIGQDLDHVT